MNFSHLHILTHGTVLQLAADRPVTNLITDSRKTIRHEGSVFFAIQGSHRDGHTFIPELYQSGLRQFVVEKEIEVEAFPEGNFIKVDSAIHALQLVAASHRHKFSVPVVGITGSNGKTIVKEWLHQLLSKEFVVVKNPGSYNSQIGVPLSVWQMQSFHTLGVFEAGISMPGEMERLQPVIGPSIGILTNIGTAHDENFLDIIHKIREKLKLFSHVQKLIFCADHLAVRDLVKNAAVPLLSWGFSAPADVQITRSGEAYSVSYGNVKFKLTFPFADYASIENAFHCITLMLHLGIDWKIIQQRIRALRHVPMRLEVKEGINQCQLIDDTYNNDLGGLQISLDFLNHQHQKTKKAVILSDVLQSGLTDDGLTTQLAQLINQSGVNRFIGIGEILKQHAHKFSVAQKMFYASTEEFLEQVSVHDFDQEIILVKGARAFQFEKIVARLQRNVHGTVMEVDLGGLVHNLNYFKSKLNPNTKVMVMVKAFAYGSGSVEVANVLQFHRVDYLGVAYADEGVELRKNNIRIPIMVMNPTPEAFHSIMEFDLEPELYGFKILHEFIAFLQGRPAKIHLKLDTGMHRLGFEEKDVDTLTEILQANLNLQVASVFTHLAGSDEAEHDAFSKQQAEAFLKCAKQVSTALASNPILHAINTPGILRLPEYQLDMVRLGVGLYGVDPTGNNHPLKVVATLKTIVSQVRQVKKGESIGYGRKGQAIKPMTIATIAIGYADGYSRAFSGGVGEVLVNGHLAKIVGNVCMDMTMIDVTGLPVQEGDEVIIFGEGLSVEKVAASIQTIPYEILTNTSSRVKRVFVAEGI
jgi:Alr-MurF fusion protein